MKIENVQAIVTLLCIFFSQSILFHEDEDDEFNRLPMKSELLNHIKIDLVSPTRGIGIFIIGKRDHGEAAGGIQMKDNLISPVRSLVNQTHC